jgi:hypothetical protein
MMRDLPLPVLEDVDKAVARFRAAAIGKPKGVEPRILKHVAANQDFPLADFAMRALL